MNRITLIGNIVSDLEIKTANNGSSILNFTVATEDRWTDRKTEEKKKATEFHRIVAFGRDAELVQQYYTKGSKIFLEGKVHYETYENKDGNKVNSTKIIMNKLEFTSNRKNSNNDNSGQEQEEGTQNQQRNYNRNQNQQQRNDNKQSSGGNNGNRQQVNSGNQGTSQRPYNKNQNQPKTENKQSSGGKKPQYRDNNEHDSHPNYEFENSDSPENDDKIPF